jgi:hypothetical protein
VRVSLNIEVYLIKIKKVTVKEKYLTLLSKLLYHQVAKILEQRIKGRPITKYLPFLVLGHPILIM